MFMVMKTKFTYQSILKNVVGVVKSCRIGGQKEIGNLNEYEDKIDVPHECLVIFHLLLVVIVIIAATPGRWFIINRTRAAAADLIR